MRRDGSYSGLQIGLHWLTAALVLFNYFYSEGMADAFDAAVKGKPAPATLSINPKLHVYVGLTVLLVTIIRIVVRNASGTPAAGGVGLEQTLAAWGQRLLYFLLLLVPSLGAITWFGKVDATADVHALMANALMLVALGHAALALFHQYILNDGLLTRMIRPR